MKTSLVVPLFSRLVQLNLLLTLTSLSFKTLILTPTVPTIQAQLASPTSECISRAPVKTVLSGFDVPPLASSLSNWYQRVYVAGEVNATAALGEYHYYNGTKSTSSGPGPGISPYAGSNFLRLSYTT